MCLTGPRSCLCSCLPGDVLGGPESVAQAPRRGRPDPPGGTPGSTPTLCMGHTAQVKRLWVPLGEPGFYPFTRRVHLHCKDAEGPAPASRRWLSPCLLFPP